MQAQQRYILPSDLSEALRKQIRSDRVLSGVTLLGTAENLTQQALLQTFSQQVGPVHSLDALPDKVPYARYVMTGGAVTVTAESLCGCSLTAAAMYGWALRSLWRTPVRI